MRVGFAGAGSMAGAMARGWAAGGGPEAMLFCDAGSGRAGKLAGEVGGREVETLAELATASDFVVLAVKPNALEAAATGLGEEAKAILSVLGATSLERLREAFPSVPVIRAMPTVLVEIQSAVICHAPVGEPEGELGDRILELLGRLGRLVEVEDELMDPATAVMGCSPAYVAVVVQALTEAGAREGLDPDLSYELVVDTFAGTAELLRHYEPLAVREAVTSPGGSTEAGLEALADAGAADGFAAAVRASLERMGR